MAGVTLVVADAALVVADVTLVVADVTLVVADVTLVVAGVTLVVTDTALAVADVTLVVAGVTLIVADERSVCKPSSQPANTTEDKQITLTKTILLREKRIMVNQDFRAIMLLLFLRYSAKRYARNCRVKGPW